MTEIQELITQYKDKVFNTCLSMVKDHEDAEDISQEVFIEVYLKQKDYRGDASISTWIYRISVNKCLQFLRKNKAKKRSAEFTGITDRLAEMSGFDHPGIDLENKELAKLLFVAIESLPEAQRVAFTLHKVEHLNHEEIGQILQKSRSAVESLIHRAKENLRRYLSAYYEKY